MNNFRYWSPTEFVFGRNTVGRLSELIKQWFPKTCPGSPAPRLLIHYGGQSAIKSGLLAEVESNLQNNFIDYVKLGGVQPNPVDSLVYEGIELCRREKVNFILAVGGGSVIDSAKAIAVGVPYSGDFWNFYDGKVTANQALPVSVILTIPAAGSEGSDSSVITKLSGNLKRGYGTRLFRPVFSIMDPSLTFTLPAYQTACGVSDMMAHIMERYFSRTPHVEVTDRLCEGLLKAIIENAPRAIAEPDNYDVRANIMWAGTVAHNGICGVGREEDWASHRLEHELSAHYGVAHGAGLSVIFPAWMEYVLTSGVDKLVQFAERVWDIPSGNSKTETARQGIAALTAFYRSIGLPVTMKELGIEKPDIDLLLETLELNMGPVIGNFRKLDMADARAIYKLAEGAKSEE